MNNKKNSNKLENFNLYNMLFNPQSADYLQLNFDPKSINVLDPKSVNFKPENFLKNISKKPVENWELNENTKKFINQLSKKAAKQKSRQKNNCDVNLRKKVLGRMTKEFEKHQIPRKKVGGIAKEPLEVYMHPELMRSAGKLVDSLHKKYPKIAYFKHIPHHVRDIVAMLIVFKIILKQQIVLENDLHKYIARSPQFFDLVKKRHNMRNMEHKELKTIPGREKVMKGIINNWLSKRVAN